MMRFMSAAWAVQFAWLLFVAFLLLLMPRDLPVAFSQCDVLPVGVERPNLPSAERASPPSLAGLRAPGSYRTSCDRVERGVTVTDGVRECCLMSSDPEAQLILAWARMLVPFILALSLLSLQAAMRTDTRLRRTMAAIFASVFGSLSYQLYSNQTDAARSPQRLAVVIATGVFFTCNVLCVLWPVARSNRPMSGSANTRPSQLWVLWAFQGLVFVGLAVLLARVDVSQYLLARPMQHVYEPVLATIREVAPPFYLAMGLVSLAATRASREWVWLGFVRTFVAFYVAWLLLFLFVWGGEFAVTNALVVPPVLALLVGNLIYVQNRVWSSEEVGEGPDGWVMTDLVAGPVLMLSTLFTRRRGMYARGVAATGIFTLAGNSKRPRHEFFDGHVDDLVDPDADSPKRAHTKKRVGLVRFSTARGHDDAGLEVRGAALRISGTIGSIDLFLSTGAHSAVENVVEYALLIVAGAFGRRGLELLADLSPRIREGGIAGLRRAPSCFSRLHYHSQVVRFWVDTRGERHLVRYRLVPAPPKGEEDEKGESGLPTERDVFWKRERTRTERRAPDYLRRELKRRLQGGATIELRLQAQFHELASADGVHWYNPGVDWYAGEGQHPWVDIGHIELDHALSDEEAEMLQFDPTNAPPSLGTPVSRGIFDFRSIADSQQRVIPRIQNVRRWIASQLGPPSFEESPPT